MESVFDVQEKCKCGDRQLYYWMLYIGPPDGNTTAFPIHYKKDTLLKINTENTKNYSKSDESPQVVNTSNHEKVPFWELVLAFGKSVVDKDSKKEHVIQKTKNMLPTNQSITISNKGITKNLTVSNHTESSIKDLETVTKNVNLPLSYESPFKDNSTVVSGMERKVSIFDSATENILNAKSAFPSNMPSKGTPRKVEVGGTDTLKDESSLLSNKPPKENSTKISDVKNIDTVRAEPSHNSSSKISEQDIKLIDTSNSITCNSSSSYCANSQECRHENMCTYLLILASSFYFYHVVGTFG